MSESIGYATIFQRLKAYILDCLILFSALIVWQTALFFVNPVVKIINSGQQPSSWQMHFWVFATVTIPFLLYFAVMQSSAKKATLGMRFFGLEVVDSEERRIGFRRALVRSIFLFVPFELNHGVMFHLMPQGTMPPPTAFMGIAFVWVVIFTYLFSIKFTTGRQSIHDLIAKTFVISKK